MKEKLLQIIEHYGLYNQLKYLHTEYFELDEAIISCDEIGHIAEELADVMVMLKQIQYDYDIADEQIEGIMNCKIDRQLERIANEQR